MSYTVSELLLRNLRDVFGENDPTRRRAAINELYNEECVFYDPNKGAHRGRDAIDRIAGVIKATHPDYQYQPIGAPEELGDAARCRWVSGTPGKAPAYAGTDFVIATDTNSASLPSGITNPKSKNAFPSGSGAFEPLSAWRGLGCRETEF
jgi:hypothetical protein